MRKHKNRFTDEEKEKYTKEYIEDFLQLDGCPYSKFEECIEKVAEYYQPGDHPIEIMGPALEIVDLFYEKHSYVEETLYEILDDAKRASDIAFDLVNIALKNCVEKAMNDNDIKLPKKVISSILMFL